MLHVSFLLLAQQPSRSNHGRAGGVLSTMISIYCGDTAFDAGVRQAAKWGFRKWQWTPVALSSISIDMPFSCYGEIWPYLQGLVSVIRSVVEKKLFQSGFFGISIATSWDPCDPV